jgi:hypothetical protein
MVKSSIDARRAAAGGAFAGLTAGLFLTLLMTVMSAAAGKDVWYGIKGAAAPFLGERAMVPGFDMPAVALGLFCHLLVSVLWAIPFALIVHRMSRAATMLLGVAWAFVVWIGMYYVVLPLVGLASMQHDAPVGRAIMFHLFYSIAMTLSLMLYQRFIYGARKYRHRQHPGWSTGA